MHYTQSEKRNGILKRLLVRACEVCHASLHLYQNMTRYWTTSRTKLEEKVQDLNCLDTVHEYLLVLAIGDERQQGVVEVFLMENIHITILCMRN